MWIRPLFLLAGILLAVPSVGEPFAYITNLDSNDVSVIDLETRSVVATVGVGVGPQGVAVNSDASRVYVANSDSDNLTVLDGSLQAIVATIPVGENPLGVAVSPDDRRFFVVCRGALWTLDAETLSVVGTTALLGMHNLGVAVSRDGERAYVTSRSEESLQVVDVATQTVVDIVELGGDAVGIDVGPDGRIWIADQEADSVHVVDGTSHEVLTSIYLAASLTAVAASPTDGRVYVTALGASAVFALDTSTYTVVGELPGGLLPAGLALSPDGSEIYVANYASNDVSVIGRDSLTLLATIPVGDIPVAFGRFIRPGPGPAITEIPTSGRLGLQILALLLVAAGLLRLR